MELTRIGKYLRVMRLPLIESGKTCVWQVYANNDDLLGLIEWNNEWRQYVFQPFENTEYSAGCLDDIAKFLRENQNTRKEAQSGEGEGC